MTAKHTPGPWHIEDRVFEEDRWVVVREEHDGALDRLAWIYSDTRGDRHEADAKLIAAAPALADALDRLMRHGDDCDRHLCSEGCPHTQAIEALRLAGRETSAASAPQAPPEKKP